mgnify:CR=1 FL=1
MTQDLAPASTRAIDQPLNPVLKQRLAALNNPILLTLVRQTIGRILGVQAIERLMRPAAGLTGMPYLLKILEVANIRVECTHGFEGLPGPGEPTVICATHATGVLDFVLHMQALQAIREDIMVVATADAMAFHSAPVSLGGQLRHAANTALGDQPDAVGAFAGGDQLFARSVAL